MWSTNMLFIAPQAFMYALLVVTPSSGVLSTFLILAALLDPDSPGTENYPKRPDWFLYTSIEYQIALTRNHDSLT